MIRLLGTLFSMKSLFNLLGRMMLTYDGSHFRQRNEQFELSHVFKVFSLKLFEFVILGSLFYAQLSLLYCDDH